MFLENLVAFIDRTLHHHGDLLIKIFSIIVAFLLLGLFFLSTRQAPSGNASNGTQQVTQ